jgi:hypothetical protein
MRLAGVTDNVRSAPVKVLRAMFTGVGQLLIAAERLRSEADEAQSAEAGRWRDAVGTRGHRDDGSTVAATASRAARSQATPRARTTRPTGSAKPAGRAYPHGVGKSKRAGNSKKSEKPKKSEKLKGDSKAKKDSKVKGKAKGKGRAVQEAERRWRSLDSTGNVRVLSGEDLADPGQGPLAPAVLQPTPVAELATIAEPEFVPAPEPAAAAPVARATRPTRSTKAAVPVPLPIAGYDGLSLASLRARLRNLDAAQLAHLLDYERANAAREDVIGMFERRIARIS